MDSMGRTLVVAAHPDDEILGCGGTLARLAKQGNELRVVILSKGVASRHDADTAGSGREEELRMKAAARAANIVGCPAPVLHDLSDNRFDSQDLLDVVRLVEAEVESFAPDTVFTHFGSDLNVDHGVAFRAVLTALRPMAGRPVKRLYAFETPSSTEWSFGKVGGPFTPDTFVDIGPYLEAKIEAMQAYEAEARPFPHPRSPEALRALAQWRGATVGFTAAEAFMTVFALSPSA